MRIAPLAILFASMLASLSENSTRFLWPRKICAYQPSRVGAQVRAIAVLAMLVLLTSTTTLATPPQNRTQVLLQQLGSNLVGTGATGTPGQGNSVAISADGNTAIVGGPLSSEGGAWIYTQSNGLWTQQGGELTPSDATGSAQMGYSVAISGDGNTAIMGGPQDSTGAGAVWIFTRSAGVWTKQGSKLVGAGATGAAEQGISVAISADGNTAIEGGDKDNSNIGGVWVFTRSAGAWTQLGSELIGTGTTGAARQGFSVSISSNAKTLVSGGPLDNSGTGGVWVFTRSGNSSSQQGAELLGNDANSGATQGTAVAVSGDGNTLAFGGPNDSSIGAVWIFTRSGSSWSQEGTKLTGADGVGAQLEGSSVALSADGSTVLFGGYADNSSQGAAWVFTVTNGIWFQQGSKLVGTGGVGVVQQQGAAVSISADGTTAIVGGNTDDGGIGAAWIFNTNTTFGQLNVGANATQTIEMQFASSFTLGNIGVLTQGAASLDFTLAGSQPSGACALGTAYNAGDTCFVNIQFLPGAPGLRSGAILFFDNAGTPNVVATVYLNGIGLAPQVQFVGGLINTTAGDGTSNYSGDGGPATSAEISFPYGLGIDSANDLFIADQGNNVVREVKGSTQVITTTVGNGSFWYAGDGSAAVTSSLDEVSSVAVDGAGNLYLADSQNNVIREVNASTGIITTVAGNGNVGYSGDDGLATSAKLNFGTGVAADRNGNLYIADSNNSVIRRVDAITGIINTVAGSGSPGYGGDGGAATDAVLNDPLAPVLDAAGNLYFSDDNNAIVRRIDADTGVITTVAGTTGSFGYSGDGGSATAAQLDDSEGLAFDSAGNLYITDSSNNLIREVSASTGIITTIAGDGTTSDGYSGDGGAATSALLAYPVTPVIDSMGNLFFDDNSNNVVREVGGAAPMNFGSVFINATSSVQDLVVTNEGNAPLTLTSITFTADFSGNGFDPPCLPSDTLNPGDSCELGVDFTPTVPGLVNGSLTIVDNAGTQMINLSGTGVAPAPTTAALTSSLNPADPGQSVTFTATISPTPTGSSFGTVNFLNGATLLGTRAVNSSGVAIFTTTILPGGSDSITAVYSGNAGFATSTPSVLTEVIRTSTATALTSSLNPASSGQSVTFTATVSPAPTGSPLGSVNFFNGATLLGNGTVNSSGVATFATSSLPSGSDGITAVYSANAGFAASTSSALTETVTAVTTTALTASANPATFGQSVTFTATVSPTPTGSLLGSVNFLNSATLLGSGTVNSSSVATFATSSLPVGANSITAVYSGNAGFATSTSSALTETITAVTTTALAASPHPATSGQSVTFTATVSPLPTGSPLGTVNFYNGVALLGNGTVNSSGVATFATSSLPAGVDSITAVYSGNAGFATSTSSILSESVTTLAVTTTTALAASVDPVVDGQPVTFTATISPAPTGTPTGTVSFYNGVMLLGAGTVDGFGVATLTISSLPPGSDSITAVYSGNAGFSTSTSSALSETVSLITTTTTLTISSNPVVDGQTLTLTATIAPVPTGSPAGSVSFNNGVTLLGSETVNGSGIATLPTGSLPTGSDVLKAVYSGDANAATSTSANVTEVVNPFTTTSTLTVSPNPAIVGQSITFTATVSPAPTGSPAGTVNFYSGATLLGSGTVNGAGIATLTTGGVPAGADSVTAVYSGNANAAASTSAAVNETVNLVTTTTTLSISPNPAVAGQPVTFTLTVSPAPTGIPAGTVNVFNGATLLGTGTVNSSGIATLTTSSLTAGSDSITAVYSGNASTATSTSAVFSLTVAAAPTFTIVAPQTPFTVAPGGFVNISITVPPLGGTYSSLVIMSASRLAGATDTFAPPSVTPGSAGATTMLTIQLAAVGLNVPPAQQRSFPIVRLGLALTVCGIFFGFRRSRTLQLGFAILALAAVTTIFVGCGVGVANEPSTPAGTYVITITGTSGAQHASTTITLIVQ